MFSFIIKNYTLCFKVILAKKLKGVVPLAIQDAKKLHTKYTNMSEGNLIRNAKSWFSPDAAHFCFRLQECV